MTKLNSSKIFIFEKNKVIMKKNILALGILSFSFFSCGDTSGGNKNILPKDSKDIVETKSNSTIEKKVTDTLKNQDSYHYREKESSVKADSTKANTQTK
ncbi:hypothetical protein C4S76_02200 [Apibacter adventoris]|nr:hypothetical protein C4S76_02200 [Apibacter adventoris]